MIRCAAGGPRRSIEQCCHSLLADGDLLIRDALEESPGSEQESGDALLPVGAAAPANERSRQGPHKQKRRLPEGKRRFV